ncbi:43088_t:CDS:2 [Gigaspora margarita]|uniref:43088_t:CDS:1 n=1 Tax=Gigaspora margarita TaxID=4874 RepID=A0ABN7UZA1_GIGMA|nr:43088_t:CDS:2 [Gigaspora margarita]
MNTEILDELKNIQSFVSQEDIQVAKFLEIANPEIVFIIRKVAKIYEWKQCQNLAGKEEPEQSTLLPDLAKSKLEESFSRKLALTISETGALDYSNCELIDIINSFIETFVQKNTIDAQLKERIVKIKQSAKSEQGMELPIPQKVLPMSKESNVIKDKEVPQENSEAFYFNTKLHWELEPVFETIQEMVDNRNKNLQKDISEKFKHEPIKEQDKKHQKQENPYINNGSASIVLKEKIQELDIDEIKNLLLNITSRLDSIERSQMNDEVFDIFAVTETNLDRKEGFFVEKKVENFKFFWLDTLIDKRKGLGVALGIKHTWKKYLGEKEVTWSNGQSSTKINQTWVLENLMES